MASCKDGLVSSCVTGGRDDIVQSGVAGADGVVSVGEAGGRENIVRSGVAGDELASSTKIVS